MIGVSSGYGIMRKPSTRDFYQSVDERGGLGQYDTPRCLISRTASSLNSRVNCLLSMTYLLFRKTPNSVSSEPGQLRKPSATARHFLNHHVDRGWYLYHRS